MTPFNFFIAVEKMRQLQREYLDTRNPRLLTSLNDLQRKVDDEIFRVRTILDAHPEKAPGYAPPSYPSGWPDQKNNKSNK